MSLIKGLIQKRNKTQSQAMPERCKVELYKTRDDQSAICQKPQIVNYTECDMTRQDRIDLVLNGIIAGDSIGAPYEGLFEPPFLDPDTADLITNKSHISDDSVLSFAVMTAALENADGSRKTAEEQIQTYSNALKKYTRTFPDAGYGQHFYRWAMSGSTDRLNSYGNGGAMRAGIVGAVFDDYDDVFKNAARSAIPSHGHKEGIKGAIAAATMVWMGFHGATKKEIVQYACDMYSDGFNTVEEYVNSPSTRPLNPEASIKEIQDLAGIAVSLKPWVTVPEAVINFNSSDNFELCMRNLLRYASDSDTVGAISGGIAAAFYKETSISNPEDMNRLTKIGHTFKEKMQAVKKG